MQAPRHIGIDLHRNQFTCCVRLENGRNYLTDWKLEDLPRLVKKLRPCDQIAVEVTGNTRLFHDAVAPYVKRLVAVDPNQFKVIGPSVKKTDPNDARNLALYLEKDLLPGGEDEGQDASATGEPNTDARHAREAADLAEEQDQQHPLRTRNQPGKGSTERSPQRVSLRKLTSTQAPCFMSLESPI
jgi:hypothetical protein